MNIEALALELAKPEYAELSDEQILTVLNEPSQVYHVAVPTADVQNYLMQTLSSTPPLTLYMKLSLAYRDNNYPAVVRAVAESAIDLANGQIKEVELGNNPLYAQMMGVLVQAGIWTQAEASSVLNLGRRTRSKAAELGAISSATAAHLTAARLLPQTQTLQALQQRHAAGANRVTGYLSGLSEQLSNGDDVDLPEWGELEALYGEVEEVEE